MGQQQGGKMKKTILALLISITISLCSGLINFSEKKEAFRLNHDLEATKIVHVEDLDSNGNLDIITYSPELFNDHFGIIRDFENTEFTPANKKALSIDDQENTEFIRLYSGGNIYACCVNQYAGLMIIAELDTIRMSFDNFNLVDINVIESSHGDINSDGLIDFVITTERNGNFAYYRIMQNIDHSFTTDSQPFTESSLNSTFKLTDMNNDNCSDLVIVDRSGDPDTIKVFMANQQGDLNLTETISNPFTDKFLVYDFDNNNTKDIFVAKRVIGTYDIEYSLYLGGNQIHNVISGQINTGNILSDTLWVNFYPVGTIDSNNDTLQDILFRKVNRNEWPSGIDQFFVMESCSDTSFCFADQSIELLKGNSIDADLGLVRGRYRYSELAFKKMNISENDQLSTYYYPENRKYAIDSDNDGNTDLICSDLTDGVITLYRRNGDIFHKTNRFLANFSGNPEIMEIDNRNNNDEVELIINDPNGVYILQNSVSAQSINEHPIRNISFREPDFTNYHDEHICDVKYCDLNTDDIKDLFILREHRKEITGTQSGDSLFYSMELILRNTSGTLTRFDMGNYDSPFYEVSLTGIKPRLMDYDNDNEFDLILEKRYSDYHKIYTIHEIDFSNLHLGSGQQITDMDFAWKHADIDNDGDMDFVFFEENNTTELKWKEFDNTSNNYLPVQTLHTFNRDVQSYEILDYNNDNLNDIIVISFNDGADEVAWCENTGNVSFNDYTLLFNHDIPGWNYDYRIADLDGDNDLDFILDVGTFAVPDPDVDYIALIENYNNSDLFSGPIQISDQFATGDIISIADIDNDGDNDIAYKEKNSMSFFIVLSEPSLPNSDTSAPEFSANITNYPNPFNPSTNISFNIKEDTDVEITIYNMKGQKVKTLVDEKFEQGQHKVEWSGTDSASKSVGSGVYFYKVDYNGRTQAVKKCVMLK